jgi:TatD DNase family protein
VAEAAGLSVEDIGRITSKNVRRLFGVGPWEAEPKLVYAIRDSLYVNLTHLCTNACTFCTRTLDPVVKGHNLRLEQDPPLEEFFKALEPVLAGAREVVFCGYGEPTLRLEDLKTLARWLKERSCRVRLNTNGQGSLIHSRDISPELAGLVDACSVSLNAQDAETYEALCQPSHGPDAYEAVKSFIRQAKAEGLEVSSTVVDVPYGVDVEACRRLSEGELGVPLRVRRYNEVG